MSRGQRAVGWCRRHPKTAGISALAVVGFVLIGAFSDAPDDQKHEAGAPTSSSAPSIVPSSAAPSSPTSVGASSVTPTVTPSVHRVTAAPADRKQRSARLATAVLATLAIKGRAPRTGYSRDQFGSAWTDDNDDPLGRNGCDTRNDILRRDLSAIVLESDSNGCEVLTGTLHDPYTDTSISFGRGQSTSGEVQIDHVVALSDAWQTGAQRYDAETRTNIGNDPLNLLAVDGPTNESKGDGDAATWLPPNKSYRCAYVARQIAVKARYKLWMTQAEHDATARVLTSCPEQVVPTEHRAASIGKAPKPAPRTSRPSAPTAAPAPPSTVYYENCDAVRAAGAAPLYRGQPGYDNHLDRDGDGVACET